MKKLLLVLALPLFLVACNDTDAKSEEVKEVTEKKDEMTETSGLYYLEEVTYRYINSMDEADGSFEQKSELQAAIGRCEAIYDEIKEEYEKGDPLPAELLYLADKVKEASEDILNGETETAYSNAEEIGGLIGTISQDYLNGELPPTAKYKIPQ